MLSLVTLRGHGKGGLPKAKSRGAFPATERIATM